MIELAKLCFAQTPDIDVQVGMVPEHEDVALTMTTHRLVVVSGHIKAIDEAEVLREIALVIPRRLCVGDRPTANGLINSASEALMQAMVRHPWCQGPGAAGRHRSGRQARLAEGDQPRHRLRWRAGRFRPEATR